MPIDISQFFQTFVEESLETLEQIEKTLLNIDIDTIDENSFNLIFRGMHTIKGSCAVFGFNEITEFTHGVESFLDLIRESNHKLEQVDIDYLLKVIDCLRRMFVNIQNSIPIDYTYAKNLSEQFELKTKVHKVTPHLSSDEIKNDLINKPENISLTTSETRHDTKLTERSWQIIFHPNRNIFQSNGEVLRLFDVLSDLGKLDSKIDVSNLPEFHEIDPMKCYLTWQLILSGDIDKKDIQEVFVWIVNEENVTIMPVQTTTEFENKSPFFMMKEESDLTAPTTSSVRVAISKIDNLINTVGEFVITKSMINQIVKDFDMNRLRDLYEALTYLEHNSRELQESVMSIRMVPIEFVFNRLPRLVHDLAQKMGKQVELAIMGEQTELDKNIVEKLTDPLIHLVRNALDHGIEAPSVRISKGKSPQGKIQLRAYQEGGNVLIDILDDGAGINKEKIRRKALADGLITQDTVLSNDKLYEIIFKPGFSTADIVTDVSGRGVGLDIVYKNINDLGGEIDIEFSDAGSIFRLRLPLTLAIMDCQLIKLNDQVYIIPLITITEIIQPNPKNINRLDNKTLLYYFRGNYIPIVFLKKIFSLPGAENELDNKFLIVVEMADQSICIVVDEVLLQQQVVIKSIEENYGEIAGISGVTILGNGSVALIVDVKALIDLALNVNISRTKYINKEQPELIDEKKQLSFEENKSEYIQFLSFLIAGQEYGVDITEVKEIRMWENTTTLPNSPSYVKGVINLRGTIVPIVNLRERFDLGHTEYTYQTAIITLTIKHGNQSRIIGILVEQVADTYTVSRKDLEFLSENNTSKLKEHIFSLVTINNRMITLLNTKNLIPLAIQQEIVL